MTKEETRQRNLKIAEALCNGKALAEISKEFKIDKNTLYTIYRMATGKTYYKPVSSKKRFENYKNTPFFNRNLEIFRLREEGMTFKEIGEKYSITDERVRQICLKFERFRRQGFDI